MSRWVIVAAAVGIFGLSAQLHAQVGRGGERTTFVPVDTTKNLATPLPVGNIQMPNRSISDRLFDALARIMPISKNRRPNLPGPQAPTTVMPAPPKSRLAGPQYPTTKLPTPPQSPLVPRQN